MADIRNESPCRIIDSLSHESPLFSGLEPPGVTFLLQVVMIADVEQQAGIDGRIPDYFQHWNVFGSCAPLEKI